MNVYEILFYSHTTRSRTRKSHPLKEKRKYIEYNALVYHNSYFEFWFLIFRFYLIINTKQKWDKRKYIFVKISRLCSGGVTLFSSQLRSLTKLHMYHQIILGEHVLLSFSSYDYF